jgi:hypothetical protein
MVFGRPHGCSVSHTYWKYSCPFYLDTILYFCDFFCLVLCSWVRSIIFIPQIESFTMMLPNKSPEPTAVGAVSSAVAVHAASRRWLSFLR